MIHRDNWIITNKYLDYRRDVLQNDIKTIRSGRVVLAHILNWADDKPFASAPKIRPTLPEYLLSVRRDGKPDPLSPAHMAKILTWARSLFEWLRLDHPSTFRQLSPSWIQSLRLRRSASVRSRVAVRQYWSLDDVNRIVSYVPDTLRKRRDLAALAFIFLSGMRGGAFVTLPIRSVDLVNNCVYQYPEWGVMTKNSKAGVTYLLPIPQLLDVVREWDTYVRAHANNHNVAWYASMDNLGLAIKPDDVVSGIAVAGRRGALYQGFRELCDLAGVAWKSPHKLRHGHGVYGLRHANNMEEYKAVSQNMMHDSVVTTDRTYSGLLNNDVGKIISGMIPDKK